MEFIIDTFSNLSSIEKLGWILICLSISWLVEFVSPLVLLNYKKWKHAGVNLVFLATSILINLIFGILTVGIFQIIEANGFGLLNLFQMNLWLKLLLCVLALDFMAQWIAHYLLHRVKWMWKFHLVHHSDTHVDATTGTRHHPGDYVIREVFSLAAIMLFGIPFAFYMFYRISTIFFTYFSHANIRIPQILDKAISCVFVSPNMHKFHHHYERPWTDSNFGNIFSIWDRLFGTFVYDNPKAIKYGVDVLDDHTSNDIMYQFKVPFDKNVKTDY